jgi:hypothetical protein
MESCRHLNGAFDSFDLEIMERALDAALQTLKAHQVMDARGEDDLKSFMGHKLTAIANVHGVSDAATLGGGCWAKSLCPLHRTSRSAF